MNIEFWFGSVEKLPFGRSKRSWMDNIKMILGEGEGCWAGR